MYIYIYIMSDTHIFDGQQQWISGQTVYKIPVIQLRPVSQMLVTGRSGVSPNDRSRNGLSSLRLLLEHVIACGWFGHSPLADGLEFSEPHLS